MIAVFQVLWQALRDLIDDLRGALLGNLFWGAISLPLPLFALFLFLYSETPLPLVAGLFLLAVLPAAPASIGLYAIGYRFVEGRVSKPGDYFAALRRYAVPAWLVLGIWVAGALLLLALLWVLPATTENTVVWLLRGFWLYLTINWAGLLIYAMPLILLQERPAVRMIIRNALVLALGRPLFTLLTLALMAALLVLVNYFPVLLMICAGILLSQWSLRATMHQLALDQQQTEMEANDTRSR
jgi:uncharacterized membrane protein YesL